MTESKIITTDSNPMVTAVLICWNHEQFVRDSIISAVEQTYKNIELIVFDNDSSDNSASIIEQLASEYNFTFIRQNNVGIVKTLNRALQMAQGKYFTMLATDDMWQKDKIQRQVAYLEANKDVDMISGHVICINDKNQEIDWPTSRKYGAVTFKGLMQDSVRVYGPTVMAKTSALRSVGGYDESIRIEDFSMALKLTYAGKEIVNTGETYTYYRRHDNNWSARPLYDETHKIGQLYRNTPEYAAFVNYRLRGYFRWLAGDRKMDAIRFLLNEPVKWSFFDVGFGVIKLLIPVSILKFYRIYFKKIWLTL